MSYLGNLPIYDHKTCEWSIFKSRLTQFLKVNDVSEEKKSAILITHLSDEAYRLVRNLAYPKDADSFSYVELVSLLDNHFKPKKCSYTDKARFYGATRTPGESLGDWAARLRGLASYCEFGAALETNLTDRFVLGLGSGPARDKLYEQDPSKMKIDRALEIAQQAESAREAKFMEVSVKEEPVYRASFTLDDRREANRRARTSEPSSGYSGQRQRSHLGDGQSVRGQQPRRDFPRCSVCGLRNHDEEKCRYKGYRCQKCGEKGHLKKVCDKNVQINNICDDHNKGVGHIPDPDHCEECHNYSLKYVSDKPINLKLLLGGKNITMELDSGSGTSVISKSLYDTLFSKYKLNKCNIKMCLYNGHKISPEGYFDIEAKFNQQQKNLKLFVIKNGGPPLLGRDFMSAFGVTFTTGLHNICYTDKDVQSLLEQFPDLWRDELGSFTKFQVDLKLKEDAVPKFFKPRTVPFALKAKVEAELDRLVRLGILVPINHSKYATPIVPILKNNGTVKIAGDYSITLNKDLLIDKYPLPRIEEVFAKLGGGVQYSKIDLKNAYNQFILSESSQELTTINTPKGLFKYTRLVYGLANAPAIFQKTMETLLAGIEGVSCWYDDICVTAPDRYTKLCRLREVLTRLNDSGLRLQKEKCEFFKDSVTYLGYVINKHGLRTSHDKVQAILHAAEPTSVTELKRFLGVVNYYRNFIPNASCIMSPLHELLRNGAQWEWTERQRRAVHQVKTELASERVLAHFEHDAQLILTVDAGPGGLGAVLAQRCGADATERPLAYASRSLTASERNYSQIQKEATAIVFGVKKFHQYLYGRDEPFILKTDHRPLVSIFNQKNGISVTTALRLQRYAIILSAYNYVVQYTTGGNNVVADFFSRAPLKLSQSETDPENDAVYTLKFLDTTLPAVVVSDIKKATETDKNLQMVIKYMNRGWPRKIKCNLILPFFHCKSDLQYENGLILRGHRVVIPTTLQDRMLRELHSTHLGIVKTKSSARSRMWWPGIDADIEHWIGACDSCVKLRVAPPRAPPAPWPRAPAPWNRIHLDYMSIGQRIYLIIVDAFTKWLECLYMQNGTTTLALINKLKYIFSIFGIPNVIVSDNDVKINSYEFNEFCSSNGIKYLTSPIYHPCSNGQAENSVRTCKKMIKSVIINENLSQHAIHEKLLGCLFDYRNTEHCTTGQTPAKLMFGRNLRTRLDLIVPEKKDIDNIYGSGKREFQPGEIVWVRWYSFRKVSWEKGEIKRKIGLRMYEIYIFKNETTCFRHIDQILRSKEDFEKKSCITSTSPPFSNTTILAKPNITNYSDGSIMTSVAQQAVGMESGDGRNEQENVVTDIGDIVQPTDEIWGDCEEVDLERENLVPGSSAEPPAPPLALSSPVASKRTSPVSDPHQPGPSSLTYSPPLTRRKKRVDYKQFYY